ncbi:hypothetical protein K7432_003336 [Basidiobolus ranarum]|uniref:Inhibitor I9 domain-containing protein n=1 Tax=Basidiobolus ranarum TaxID=34480 RepID=A0ABR2X075_9FUNG
MSNIKQFLFFILASLFSLLYIDAVNGKACASSNPEDHRYIVLLKKNHSSEQFETYLKARIDTYNQSANICFTNSFETLADMKDTHIYLARITDQIVNELKNRADVESVEKDGIVTITDPKPTGSS